MTAIQQLCKLSFLPALIRPTKAASSAALVQGWPLKVLQPLRSRAEMDQAVAQEEVAYIVLVLSERYLSRLLHLPLALFLSRLSAFF